MTAYNYEVKLIIISYRWMICYTFLKIWKENGQGKWDRNVSTRNPFSNQSGQIDYA